MALQLQNFTSLVQNSAAAVQGACSQLLDLTIGSALRAILEANASIALWLQWLIVQVLSITRLATSTGLDADSFVNDFAMFRLPAVSATGSVTFSRLTAGVTTLIPVGAQVKSQDGTQIFAVTANVANTAWDAAQTGYDLISSALSVTVPVSALTAGSGGNMQPNAITLLASAIPGVDSVTNAVAFTNGVDQESDTALKARFTLYIAGLSKATLAAIGYAILSVQQGLNYAVIENSPANGDFLVVIDDGSGNPSFELQDAVFAAVDLVRPVGTGFSVTSPVITNVVITFTITVATGINKLNLLATVETAVTAFVDALTIGSDLSYTKIAQIIYDAAPGQITNVTALLVNGGTSDVAIPANGVTKIISVVAS